MHTKEMASEYRLARWAGIMRERRESGLNVRAFCRKAGFHENVYYYWQRKLREAAHTQIVQSPPVPCFAEVRVESPPALPQPPERQTGRLCVEFAGMRLTADGDYPPERLAALLRELMPC